MEQINAYKATDGSLWEDPTKAELHEIFLKKKMIIEEFLNDSLNPYQGTAQKNMVRVAIVNWEFWKNKNAK